MADLPEGFEIDAPSGGASLPPGFEIDPRNYSLGEVPGAAVANAGKSTTHLLGGLWDAVTHPLDTAENVGRLVMGAVQRHGGDAPTFLPQWMQDALNYKPFGGTKEEDAASRKKNEDTAAAFGQMMLDRYGSYENIKRTMAEDPVGAVADVLSVTPAGAVRTTGRLAATGTRTAASAAGTGGRAAAEMLSGMPREAQRLATEAGRLGGEEGAAYRTGVRGASAEDLAAQAREVPGQMRATASREYDRAKFGDDTTPGWINNSGELSIDPIIARLADLDAGNRTSRGTLISPTTAKTLNTIRDELTALDRRGVPITVEELDALKRRLGETVLDGLTPGTSEYRVAKKTYNAVKDVINEAAPSYAAAMRAYGTGLAEAKGVERALSLKLDAFGNPVAQADTTMNKLLKSLRAQSAASSTTGAGAAMGAVDRFNPLLKYQLAGSTAASLLPHGLARTVAGFSTGAALHGSTLGVGAIVQAVASSPRLVGELNYLMGAAGRRISAADATVRRIAARAGMQPEMVAAILEAERMRANAAAQPAAQTQQPAPAIQANMQPAPNTMQPGQPRPLGSYRQMLLDRFG